jgi:hypothetical protein
MRVKPRPKRRRSRKINVEPSHRANFAEGIEQVRNLQKFDEYCEQLRRFCSTSGSVVQCQFLTSAWFQIEIHIRESLERVGIFPRGGAR